MACTAYLSTYTLSCLRKAMPLIRRDRKHLRLMARGLKLFSNDTTMRGCTAINFDPRQKFHVRQLEPGQTSLSSDCTTLSWVATAYRLVNVSM